MMMSSPEPMALGSPTQSPTASANPMNQYLPQFLLGEMTINQRNHASQSNRYWPNTQTNSPPRGSNLIHNHNHYHGSSSQTGINIPMSRNYPSSGYDLKLNLNPSGNYMDMKNEPQSSGYGNAAATSGSNYSPHSDRTQNNILDSRGAQVPGAPPVNRLVDILNKPTFNVANDSRPKFGLEFHNSNSEMNMRQMGNMNNLDITYTPVNNANPNRLSSPPSPTQVDPFYIYGESIKMDDKLDETWITLFGFPQSATSYVLQEFSVYGQIVKHVPSSQGNWLHIKYQTKLQAKKALSKNGKVLANSLMIGCMPCIDKSVMGSSGVTSPQRDHTILSANSNTSLSENALSTSPPSLGRPNGGIGGRTLSNATRLDRTQSLRTTVRPLGQFNRNLDSTLSPNDNSSKLPKKNTNVISKAMEFMFGW